MTKISGLALLALMFVPMRPGMAAVQTADEIVEKHLAALGGRAALAKLTTRRATGTVSVSTPVGDLSGPIEVLIKAPNKTRASMDIDLTPAGAPGTMTLVQMFDGAAGWTLNSMQGDTAITGRQLLNMTNNVFPSSLLNYKQTGLTVALQPREKIEGREAIVLLVTKSALSIRLFLDAETYLVVRTVSTQDSPDGGALEQTSTVSDYRTVDGVKVSFKSVSVNELQSVTIAFDKIEHNVPIDDGVFVKK